ncbi:MAG: 4Fe-4S binding protein [Kiritimatiellae bacterium]|nr:4Fe-4S binding protein [Kiritimatiellia bacterium]
MRRKIITIDEQTCTGCGLCIPNCPEGAIQLIDGKARLVSDLFCDGLGACLGHCPEGAITIEEREAEPYDEEKVMTNIIKQGPNVIKAHLEHLKGHGQQAYLETAIACLERAGEQNPLARGAEAGQPHPLHEAMHGGCPGSRSMRFEQAAPAPAAGGEQPSQLTHWPVQLHLMSPQAPPYQGADVLLAADCVAYALGAFHAKHLKGRALAIACPKLDEGQDRYLAKIRALIDEAKINTLTVMIMEVPCCGGLLRLAQQAAAQATRKVPVKCVTIGIRGDVLGEEWV